RNSAFPEIMRLLKGAFSSALGPIPIRRARRSANASRRHAEFLFEGGREGTLIGKAVADGNLRNRPLVQLLVGKILPRTLEPLGTNVRAHGCVRRLEDTVEIA